MDLSALHSFCVVGAIGYSLVWMLAGGGLFGAVVIFLIAKSLGK